MSDREPALRILVLSVYYPPDLGPGALRAAAFVRAMVRLAPPGTEVEVITTVPSRYARYRPDADTNADAGTSLAGVSVHRVAVGSGRLRGFARYVDEVLRATAGRDFDLVFATSARLGTAVLAARVARRRGLPLAIDLRDDVAADLRAVFGLAGALALPALRALERYALARASVVSLVSPAFVASFRSRWPARDFLFVPHGIPTAFAKPAAPTLGRTHDRIVVLYAGTIGECQALHRIVPEMAQRLRDSHHFEIVGDGSRRAELARRVAQLPNVTLRDPMPAEALARRYANADVLLVSLEARPAFEAVVPSKLFEVVAQGKTIVAGVGGEAAKFLRLHAPDARIFAPGDADGAIEALRSISSADSLDRSRFRAEFAQDVVIESLVRRALECAARSSSAVTAGSELGIVEPRPPADSRRAVHEASADASRQGPL